MAWIYGSCCHHRVPTHSTFLPAAIDKPLWAPKAYLFTWPLDPISFLLVYYSNSSLSFIHHHHFFLQWIYSIIMFLMVFCLWSSSRCCFIFVLNLLFSHILCLIYQQIVSFVLKMYSESYYLSFIQFLSSHISYSIKLKSDLTCIIGIASHRICCFLMTYQHSNTCDPFKA